MVLRLVCELGDAGCTRPMDDTRMSRWVFLLALLALYHNVSENKS